MKSISLLATATFFALSLAVHAESTVTLNGIHNCCKEL